MIETACFYNNFTTLSTPCMIYIQAWLCFKAWYLCPAMLLTSADVRPGVSPDHVGAAQTAQVPEEEEQGDEVGTEAHHGDLDLEQGDTGIIEMNDNYYLNTISASLSPHMVTPSQPQNNRTLTRNHRGYNQEPLIIFCTVTCTRNVCP